MSERAGELQGAVLIVEDDQDIRETLAELLVDEGYAVASAPGGAAALDLLRAGRGRPALVLLDLMMPGMSGAELRRELLRDPALADLPVVIVSADARAEERAAELGVAGCLRKPVKLDTLLAVTQRFVRA